MTYVIQRTESLMGLFYLLTLYCFIRYEQAGLGLWGWLSIAACLLGMATKEVMVSAPLMVLLYDRTFVSGTFLNAWRSRRRLYAGLACTWLPLGCFVLSANGRGGTAGFGSGVAWWAYAVTQFRAITHYIRLSFWPHPLLSDYGGTLGGPPFELARDAAFVILLAAAAAYALSHRGARGSRRALGFAGAWFFVILAPSSSVVPVATEIIAEHRMYLSLAAVIAVAVCGLDSLFSRLMRKAKAGGTSLCLCLCLILAAGLGFMTSRRNQDYASPPISIWSDAVRKSPGDASAHYDLGVALFQNGNPVAAIAEYKKAVGLRPDYPEAFNDLGIALVNTGRSSEAIAQFEEAARLKPDYADADYNLGLALAGAGRLPEAIASYERCLQFSPGNPGARANLGAALVGVGRVPEAIAQYEQALRLKPDYPEAHYNLGTALAQTGRIPEAIPHFEEAIRLKSDYTEAHANLGIALANTGRLPEAITQFEQTLRLNPNYADIHYDLGVLLQQAGRTDEAKTHLQEAERLRGKQ